VDNVNSYRFSKDLNFFSLPALRPVRRSVSEVGRFIEGGLTRHPLGRLKDSVNPQLTRSVILSEP
jgi:hypothetical protein